MKKLLLVLPTSTLLFACASLPVSPKNSIDQAKFAGEWSCRTHYHDLNVGVVDIISLKPDQSLSDESYIFDNVLSAMVKNQITDYFKSPFLYLKKSTGTWRFENNQLIYNIKPISAKRLIYPKVFQEIQASERIKDIEEKLFSVYSNLKEDQVILDFVYFTKNGFVANQKIGKINYRSQCTMLNKADYKFSERLTRIKNQF